MRRYTSCPGLVCLFLKYPAAQKLQESDFVNSSFIDELEQSGFIQRLYSGDPRAGAILSGREASSM